MFLLEGVADILAEVSAGPGGEATGVLHGPGVGVLGWGKFSPQPGGNSPVLCRLFQHVLQKCQLVIGWQNFILAHDWSGMLQKQRGKLV